MRDDYKYLIAGGIAGVVSRTCTAPLDRLKVLLQTDLGLHRQYSQIISIKKGILKIYQNGGLPSFYRGNGINAIKILPESAFKYYVFEHVKQYLCVRTGKCNEELGICLRLISGGLAGLVSQALIYPIETIKTRMMAQINNTEGVITSNTNNSILNTVKKLWLEDGPRAFYRGSIPALIGIIPYAAVDLAVFETLKRTWIKVNGTETKKIPIYIVLACGMTSGTCGAVLIMQAQGTPSHPVYYSSVYDVVKKTYGREGVVGFYRGLAPTLLKVLPAVSISYAVYEQCKHAMFLD